MQNFELALPTEVIFGRDIEAGVGEKIKSLGGTKVLIHYGGGSVKRSGLFDKITASLSAAGLAYVELGGVSPNPKLSFVREGIALCKAEGVDFLLAVGGGSAIDSTKSIAMGLHDGRDVWDIITSGNPSVGSFPFGCVLTLSAAGSETSNSQVITNEETGDKRGINFQGNRPLFAYMNPENTYSVSKFQTGCGIVDIMMHTMERYFTPEQGTDLVDDMAEGLLRNVMKAGSAALANPEDYTARATLMWAGSISHNGLFGTGKVLASFPAHKLEHEMSGMFDRVAHGAGLAVIFPAWASYAATKQDPAKFAKFAVTVMGVDPAGKDELTLALAGIDALKAYYQSIDMPVTLGALDITAESIDGMVDMLLEKSSSGLASLGEILPREEIVNIFKLAL
ncbi:MAG: iron-containing alcohol dehydrogenase [Faecalibacterium sp.]